MSRATLVYNLCPAIQTGSPYPTMLIETTDSGDVISIEYYPSLEVGRTALDYWRRASECETLDCTLMGRR